MLVRKLLITADTSNENILNKKGFNDKKNIFVIYKFVRNKTLRRYTGYRNDIRKRR